MCICEPRGNNGLEGFILNDIYKHETTVDHFGCKYKRVYLTNGYYETCGPLVFKRYFLNLEDDDEKQIP